MSNVAFLGLGRMGEPMAANLVRAGHHVTVWNRSPDKATSFAEQHGAAAAATPREAAAASDVVITMLADDAAVEAVFDGPDGILAGLRVGAVAVDMSTVSPETVTALADRLAQHGITFHDAPVSGSVAAASAATLTIMLGGEPDEVTRSVLGAIGAPVIAIGPVGAGSAMKLAVNAVVHAINGAVSESLVLAERCGIDPNLAYDVLENSAVAAPFVKYRRTAFLDPERTPTAFLLTLAAKDVRLARELAERVGAQLPQAAANAAVLEQAAAAGFGELDETAVAQYLRHAANVTAATNADSDIEGADR